MSYTNPQDVELNMSTSSINPPRFPPPSSHNASLNVSRVDDSDRGTAGTARTDDMSDFGADRETIGARYACPTMPCGTPKEEKQVYTNPKYAPDTNLKKKKYPTLDRLPSRAPSQTTVHSEIRSTADLMNAKKPEEEVKKTGPLDKFKSFWKDPRYDKIRALILISVLIILLLLIIILPITLRKQTTDQPPVYVDQYETVFAPLAVCANENLNGYKRNGVSEFRGIPYALPPVNSLRWKPAARVTATNCRDLHYPQAKNFGQRCPQSSFERSDGMENEDCLYLNVWTPGNVSNAEKLPVMVWFHGGDFRTGSGSEIQAYPLAKIITEGNFVLVSMNFRLSALGFMALDALPDTNVGLSDQIAALQWVQQNINGFGGDPNKVTAFGLGSGATSILALLNSPAATGLFQRAWLMSPGLVRDDPVVATKAGNYEFVRRLGCDIGNAASVTLCLNGKKPSEIYQAVPWYASQQWAAPQKFDVPIMNNKSGALIVSDDLVGGHGTFDSLNNQSWVNKQIPVIIGSTEDEADLRPPSVYFGDGSSGASMSSNQMTDIQTRLNTFSRNMTANIAVDYPNLDSEQGFTRLVTDIRCICPLNEVADNLNKLNVQVYRYIYDAAPAMKLDALGYNFWSKYSFHGVDMLSFFGAVDGDLFGPYFSDAAKTFAQKFRASIYKFVRGETIGEWSPMPKYMYLTPSSANARDASLPNYPRNCSYWFNATMIPMYSWSN